MATTCPTCDSPAARAHVSPGYTALTPDGAGPLSPSGPGPGEVAVERTSVRYEPCGHETVRTGTPTGEDLDTYRAVQAELDAHFAAVEKHGLPGFNHLLPAGVRLTAWGACSIVPGWRTLEDAREDVFEDRVPDVVVQAAPDEARRVGLYVHPDATSCLVHISYE